MRGADVDGHEVLRMWNHDWQPAERYGSRYDYGLFTSTEDAQCTSKQPTRSWFFYNIPHEKAVFNINEKPVITLDHDRWYRDAKKLGAEPETSKKALKFTRGFAAVAAAIEHLRPSRIIGIGLDILRNGMTGVRYYDDAALPYYVKAYPLLARAIPRWAKDEMPVGQRRDGPHDYGVEAALVRLVAAEAGVELAWQL